MAHVILGAIAENTGMGMNATHEPKGHHMTATYAAIRAALDNVPCRATYRSFPSFTKAVMAAMPADATTADRAHAAEILELAKASRGPMVIRIGYAVRLAVSA